MEADQSLNLPPRKLLQVALKSPSKNMSNSLDTLRARRLRLVGGLICVVGLMSAAIVYWRGTHAEDLSADPSMIGFDRASRRQVGVLYGKVGEMVEDLSDDLKQPRTQAIIIALLSGIIGAGCFYFAGLFEQDGESS
jgi:hypothetical protein